MFKRHFTDEKPRQKDKKLQKEVTPILESLSSGKKSGGGLRRDEATPTPGPSTVGNQRSIEDRRIRHRMMAKRYRHVLELALSRNIQISIWKF